MPAGLELCAERGPASARPSSQAGFFPKRPFQRPPPASSQPPLTVSPLLPAFPIPGTWTRLWAPRDAEEMERKHCRFPIGGFSLGRWENPTQPCAGHLPSTGPGTGLGLVGEGAGRLHSTPPILCPSCCSDSPTAPVTPPPLPHPRPAPTFLILTIIKRPRVLWDPLILFALLYWRN